MSRTVVVGGGIAGAVAALRLAEGGQEVVLLEAGDALGGLVVSFSVGGTPLECFYHHVFPHEHEVIALVDELGLGDRMRWLPSSVGVLADGRLWPFTTPLDLLRFGRLTPLQRVHAGVGALRLGRESDWQSLDRVSALDWLARSTGEPAAREIWRPLLSAKFGPAAPEVPAAWMWGRIQQRLGARGRSGGELLGYLEGGFRQVFDALAERCAAAGVDVRTSTRALEVQHDGGRVTGVRTTGGDVACDAVLHTGAVTALERLVDADHVDPRWRQPGLGVLVVVLELSRPLSGTYWTNVCDDRLPFGGIIEHTNLLPAAQYGGRSVVYLSRYWTQEEAIASADPDEEAERWIAALDEHVPWFDRSTVLAVHPFRAPYAAPLVRLGHLERLPPLRAEGLDGLYVSTTAQIYPQDRGMSEGVRTGAEAARAVLEDAGAVERSWSCPVCGGRASRPRWAVTTAATENGVAAEAFRPSADRYGETVAAVVLCAACTHASLAERPSDQAVAAAYGDAADAVSLDEERGQVETALRGLARVERHAAPGRLLDVGCWTGSLVAAAQQRGWKAEGVEPSTWAVARARERGLDVREGSLGDGGDPSGAYDCVTACDVLEHLLDPADAVRQVRELLVPGGLLYLTVPDAGSPLARLMGRRWWSVLPMHVQYFTRASMTRLLEAHGFRVLEQRTHPKAFTAEYYLDRLGGYAPPVARAGTAVARRLGQADRLVAPDFRDRLEVVARRVDG